MSFVTTQPEALTAAASTLRGIGSALAAQNAAAAAPTTGLVPAAADEVSALQATQFAAYGTLYQQISAQATAVHEAFVQTLAASAESYDATEATNAAAGGAPGSWINDLISLLTGSVGGPYGLVPAAVSNGGIAGAMQVANFGSAASDLLQLGSAGFLAPGTLAGDAGSVAAGSSAGAGLTGSVSPASAAGAAPVSAGVGQAGAVGRLSVPPSWAGASTPAAAAPATLAGAGWTSPAGHAAAVSTVPAGLPAMAATERGGFSFGLPRYGVKPTVMPRPRVV